MYILPLPLDVPALIFDDRNDCASRERQTRTRTSAQVEEGTRKAATESRCQRDRDREDSEQHAWLTFTGLQPTKLVLIPSAQAKPPGCSEFEPRVGGVLSVCALRVVHTSEPIFEIQCLAEHSACQLKWASDLQYVIELAARRRRRRASLVHGTLTGLDLVSTVPRDAGTAGAFCCPQCSAKLGTEGVRVRGRWRPVRSVQLGSQPHRSEGLSGCRCASAFPLL